MLKLSDLSIYTIRHWEAISKAIETGSIQFTEGANWKTGSQLLDNANQQGKRLVVLLGDSTKEQKGIMAWGFAKAIKASRSGSGITLEAIQAIPSRPLVWSLWCESTGERLSRKDQRGYKIVQTPDFLLRAPRTFVLTWNPAKQVPVSEFENIAELLSQGRAPEWNWTCRSFNKVGAGDRFLMLRQGVEPKGIVGSGFIRSDGYANEDGKPYVDILWTHAVTPDKPLATASIRGAETFHWTPQGSGIEMPENVATPVWESWMKYSNKFSQESNVSAFDGGHRHPSGGLVDSGNSNVDPAASVEGRLVESWSSRRERDPNNRATCITTYGVTCAVCDMNFLSEYGAIGAGFIHVHHENPLGGSSPVGALQDAIEDLKPVCPNCHAMLHRGMDASKGEVRTVAELRVIRAGCKEAQLSGPSKFNVKG